MVRIILISCPLIMLGSVYSWFRQYCMNTLPRIQLSQAFSYLRNYLFLTLRAGGQGPNHVGDGRPLNSGPGWRGIGGDRPRPTQTVTRQPQF